MLYRQHNHREELVKELAERGIPFSIEGLDVLDTPEVRDVVACLSAAVAPNDAASLFRVAALPQFAIDPEELRAAMRAVRRDELDLPQGAWRRLPRRRGGAGRVWRKSTRKSRRTECAPPMR